MSTILSTVTEAEAKVVDTVRSIQGPVVDYVRKGVEFADARLPEVTYPKSLPRPGEVVDSQVEFVKALLDAERDLVKAVIEAIAPLTHAESSSPEVKTVKPVRPKARTTAKTHA